MAVLILLKMVKQVAMVVLALGLLQMKWSTSAQESVTIVPLHRVLKIPSAVDPTLTPGFGLVCGLEPSSLTPQINYTTQWVTPGGQIINTTSTGRLFINEVISPLRSPLFGTAGPITILLITQWTFRDSGVYTCEGRNNASNNSLYASATTEIQLCLVLQSNDSILVATNTNTSVEMTCEMSAFIRPDSSLIWEGPDGQTITPGTGVETSRYRITFTNGSPNASVNGSFMLFPSRLSTLIISDPEPLDNGSYTCRVVDTDQAITIELVVLNDNSDASGTDFTSTSSTTFSTERLADNSALIIAGSIIAVVILGLLAIATITLLSFLGFHVHNIYKRKEHSEDGTPMNEHPLKISRNNYHDNIINQTFRSSVTVDSSERSKVLCGDIMTDGVENIGGNKLNVVTEVTEKNDAFSVVTDGDGVVANVKKAHSVITDGMEENRDYGAVITEAYGVVNNSTEDIITEDNDTYGTGVLVNDGVEEENAYETYDDGIEVMYKNEAYGMVTDGIVEKNEAYGVVTDGIEGMEKNEAYGVVTEGIADMEESNTYEAHDVDTDD